MEEHDIFIDAEGHVQMVYSDATVALFAGEPCTVRRASHVEPHPTKGVGWIADMSPSGGPVLGADGTGIEHDFWPHASQADSDAAWARVTPFATRQEALDIEAEWLQLKMAAGTLQVQP